ncbi:hypothetical protein FHT44_005072 [Mycolicibacterium sp. BK634]|uniref:hypothetical protein n=1 Tax=Mycolicibacterium sp. BK634 TaxID=2587099 RepID=UPI0016186508|nr:hypothetical protein [Mycolicibacterium sp. BK634]MBB3752560.1 hypothetical protein [Mycolicibacterium sp. BK634]
MSTHDHINEIAKAAYLEVMASGGILGILADRETVPDELLLALTADDVTELYESFIAPAIDNIEDALLSGGIDECAICHERVHSIGGPWTHSHGIPCGTGDGSTAYPKAQYDKREAELRVIGR